MDVRDALGNVLLRTDRLWQLPYGTAANVTAGLLRPPIELLCGEPQATWRGAVLLADDWSTPGCSMETRTRVAQAAGVAAVVFTGTEGVPFDWDGSDTSGLTVHTGVVSWAAYGELVSLMGARGGGGILGDPYLNATLLAAPTPLLHPAFAAAQWTLLALAVFGVAVNLSAAGFQLYRLSRSRAQLLTLGVVCLEGLSSLVELIFLVDGPLFEHTHMSSLPFFMWRLAQSLQVQAEAERGTARERMRGVGEREREESESVLRLPARRCWHCLLPPRT